ncbi:hypothetical protein TNCV_811581 [Trichonephila clavipes]|nr:hypothetical protein TNCV_811581 [Trichonephila clavipes]
MALTEEILIPGRHALKELFLPGRQSEVKTNVIRGTQDGTLLRDEEVNPWQSGINSCQADTLVFKLKSSFILSGR